MTINNENKKLNVPNLRFPEFQGEWEKCKLRDVCTFLSGGTPKVDVKEYWNGTIPFVSAISMHDTYILDSKLHISEEGLKHGSRLLTKNNLLLLVRGSMLWNTIPICLNKSDVAFNQDVKGIIANDTINNEFLLYWLKSKEQRLKYMVTGTGLGAGKLDTSDLLSMIVYIPAMKEQDKVARLLSLFDERIATQHKVIDKLQSLIKGMEDNLLDNPLWEKTYLRSFMQFFPTNSLSWEQLSYKEGAIRNLHYGLIHGFQTRGINSASLPMIKNEAVPKQYILCQVGDVAFADASEDTGEIAKSVEFVDTIEGDTICGLHTIHGRDIKNRTVVGFKGFAFNSRYFHDQIKRLAQGTKVFSITANNLYSCYVYLPDLDTQTVIVKLLKSYEEQLIIGRMILKQYEKQKQYLLRQMFI